MVQINDISYEEKGTISPPVICLHGIGGDSKSFEPQLLGLSGKHRVIAWNMPGYQSSKPLEKVTFEELSNSLKSFLDNLQIYEASLLGQSIGGMVAQDFFFRYPEKVKSLTLIATTSAFGGRDERFKKKFLDLRLKPLSLGKKMSELAEQFVPEILGNSYSDQVLENAINSMSKIPIKTYKDIISCLVSFNRYRDFEKIDIPCCLIAGREDMNSPFKTMEKMSFKLKNAEFHCIKDAGHLVNLEAPDKTNKIILKFLENNLHDLH